MSFYKSIILLSVVGLIYSSVSGAAVGDAKWNKKMQELATLLPQLLSDVDTPKGMLQERKKKEIIENTKRMSTLAHDLGPVMKAKGGKWSDPSFKFIAGLMERETKRAYQALEAGQWDYARKLLHSVGRYCISCHTRSKSGPEFSASLEKSSQTLSTMEKAELAAAMRRFDQALKLFNKIALDPNAPKKSPFEWERSVNYVMTILVRYKADPKAAEAFLSKLLGFKDLPVFFQGFLVSWRNSVRQWAKETKKTDSLTAEKLLAQARSLMSQALKLKNYPADHSADVYYLRATAAAHTLMEKFPTSPLVSEAMLIAGEAYGTLDYPGIWMMNEHYFEGCIRNAPHTKVAEKCFNKFEQSIYFGYSGSGGTSIPSDVKTTIRELKKLAVRKK